MEFPSVSDVHINKPKKDGGSYFGNIYIGKKKVLEVNITNATCVSYDDDNIIIKSKEFLYFIADLNSKVTDIVKANCNDWFGNNMSLDLIEEYFINPIKFSKRHGSVLKLKHSCSSEFEYSEEKKYDIVLTLKGIRFLKQKFGLEWQIQRVEESRNIEFEMLSDIEDSESSNDEDLPEPIPDDLAIMKEEYINIIINMENDIVCQQQELQKRLAIIQNLKNNIEEAITLKDMEDINNKIAVIA